LISAAEIEAFEARAVRFASAEGQSKNVGLRLE